MRAFEERWSWRHAMQDSERLASMSILTKAGVSPVNLECTKGPDPAAHGQPWIDQQIAQLATTLRGQGVVAQFRPSPWGHPYMVALTHDIDVLSLSDLPLFGRSTAGVLYRSVYGNGLRSLAGRMSLRDYLGSVRDVVGGILSRKEDPRLAGTLNMLEVEAEMGVRSSCYFITERRRRGIGGGNGRICHYRLEDHARLLERLAGEGWEVGLHGLDAWVNAQLAAQEKAALERVLGSRVAGVRMHYLMWGSESFRALEEAGFDYDSTHGFNSSLGTSVGTDLAFLPEGCSRLMELPINVHDVALMGRAGASLVLPEVMDKVEPVLTNLRKSGGCLNVLWHNNSFVSPRQWGEAYRWLVARSLQDGALVTTARAVVEWLRARRTLKIRSFSFHQRDLELYVEGARQSGGATATLRLSVPPEAVGSCNVPWTSAGDSVEIKLEAPMIHLGLKGPVSGLLG